MLNERDNEMLEQMVTGNETWIHYYMPESKCQNIQWKHQNSLSVVKFNKTLTLQKSVASVLWDSEGVILADFM